MKNNTFALQMENSIEIRDKMNALGRRGEAFVFITDFEGKKARVFSPGDKRLIWQANGIGNNNSDENSCPVLVSWKLNPVTFERYKNGFDKVLGHINNGDTYLLNYTQPTAIETNLSLADIFRISSARYKILIEDRFVCFSPEIFVEINKGKISSFPMKGTIDAGIKNAKEQLLNDVKETAEHNTIVDLIRNDLSIVAENVTVEKFRYLERITTNCKDLWQVSSKITGDLPANYAEKIGDIIFALLPAGSVSGAPKKKTVEIIKAAEKYDRGFYTGVFGYFDGENLDSCVLIRFIEKQNGKLIYKSGGGITFLSDAVKEYDELIEKIYVPIVD